MPTLTYDYVYFASGPHQRQPRAAGGPGGFSLIQSIPGGTLTSGDTFVVGAQPATQVVNGQTYNFAFSNISGGTTGGQNSFSANTPPPIVTVGSSPIVVLVVYIPVGGNGPGSSGATIDSFDETTGALFSDTFVTVSPDPGGALTTSGNVEGYVSTANAETITALSPTSPTGVDFDQWVILGSTGPKVSGAALAVAKGASPSALAFYKTPPPLPAAEVACQGTVKGLEQMIAIGIPGPLFTVTEWANVQANLKKCVQEGYLTQVAMNSLVAEYLAYAHNKNPGPVHSPVKL